MGCSGSKLGSVAEEEVPAGIRPLLRRRLEEMKKRNHAGVLKGTQTLSKKELLRHRSDVEETENDTSMRTAKVAPAPEPEEKQIIHEEKMRENPKEEEKEEKEGKVLEVVKEEKNKAEEEDDDRRRIKGKEDDDDEEEEEEEGKMSNFDERMICPGSPSFRVYCMDGSDDEGDSGEEKEKLQMEEDSVIVETNKELMNKTEKKGRKGRRFGIALPRTTPGKYLFNVTSCYSQKGCMGNQHSRLRQEKSMER